jgi:hypothetical protein
MANQDQLWLHSVPTFTIADSPITLRSHVESEKPFTVAGECGAMMGQQDGSFESWIFPVKLFSHMSIEAHVSGYDVPIDVNRDAGEIEVSPDHTTITYSHIAFTLKEILFATKCSQQDGTGIMALFQLSSIRPMTLTFSFTPEMKNMWPAPISGTSMPSGSMHVLFAIPCSTTRPVPAAAVLNILRDGICSIPTSLILPEQSPCLARRRELCRHTRRNQRPIRSSLSCTSIPREIMDVSFRS